MLRITISIVTIAVVAISLYLLIALPLLQDSQTATAPVDTSGNDLQPRATIASDVHSAPLASEQIEASPSPASASSPGSRLIEIFGTVSDADGQPLEDVLITEERYFFSTTSDAFGRYRLLLDLPWHRLPSLNFLRAGYRGKRVALTQSQLHNGPVYQLDLALDDSDNTLQLNGWVANDIGIALEGVRVTIKALDSDAEGNFYLTVFSDERGNFTLEGVHSATHYHLSATLAPEYPAFSDENFYLGSEPKQLEIVLKSLKFVDLGGMILTPDGTPVADLEIYIKNVTTGLHTRKIISDSSGFFSLEQFPLGEVSLTTRGAEFYKINGLEINEANYSNLALVVDRGDRYLSGWVTDNHGLPVEKAMVTLDTTRTDGAIEYLSYRSQSTDANGRFSFENIARGEHRVSAYASGFDKLEMMHSIERPSEQLQLTLTRP